MYLCVQGTYQVKVERKVKQRHYVQAELMQHPHGLIPMVGFAFDPVENGTKGLFAYGLTCLFEYHFDNIIVRYSLNR